jgi:DNA replication protein DnaC
MSANVSGVALAPVAAIPEADALRIDAAFKDLHMPGARRTWRALAAAADAPGLALTAYLAALLDEELRNRAENVLRERLRQARFPVTKTLDGFDFAAQPSVAKATVLALARGDFVRAHQNAVLVGGTGTGKTHLAIGIGLCCLQAGYRVRFTTAVALANDLMSAAAEHRLTRVLAGWRRADLVILDELGFLPLSREGGQALFQFIADRYETAAVLITTNLAFARWTEVFGDATMTAALLDRLLHHAHILEHTGDSHRFHERTRRPTEDRP